MTAPKRPARRLMPSKKALQDALKQRMRNAAERIAANVFFLFALGVIATGAWMWREENARILANMFIVIGIIAAIFARSYEQ